MFRAAWRTCQFVIASPTRFFRTPSILADSSSEPVYFAMLLYGFAMGLTFSLIGIGMAIAALVVSSQAGEGAFGTGEHMLLGGMSVCYPLFGFVIGPFSGGIYVVIAASLNWVGTRIFGERRSFASLLRAEAYASAAFAFAALPIAGLYLAQFYKFFYLDVVALRTTADITTGRAIGAFWLPRVALGCLFLVPYVAVMLLLMEAGPR